MDRIISYPERNNLSRLPLPIQMVRRVSPGRSLRGRVFPPTACIQTTALSETPLLTALPTRESSLSSSKTPPNTSLLGVIHRGKGIDPVINRPPFSTTPTSQLCSKLDV